MAKWIRAAVLSVAVVHGLPSASADDTDFSISSLPGLQWWASAQQSQMFANPNQTGTVANGDPVGFISDLAGQGHDAVMGDSIVPSGNLFRPQLQTGVVRGRPGILYDGASDFSSLQGSLIDGASAVTLAFAIAGANSSLAGRRLWGASDGVNVGGLGFSANGQPRVDFKLHNDSTAEATDLSRFGFGNTVGNDTAEIVIARFVAGGNTQIWVNGMLRDSRPSLASSGDTIRSLQLKFLGNQNSASNATGETPIVGQGGKFYFLEGLAATSAISDTQIGQLYQYLSKQWPTIQVTDTSPNLYWNAAVNPDRAIPVTVVSPANHIEGVAASSTQRYIFHTSLIEQYDRQWNLITNNQAVFTGVPTTYGALDHIGDGDYFNGKLYAPLEAGVGGGGQFIGVYDATAPGLPLLTTKDITAQHHEFSAVVAVPEHGANGILYATSYFPTIGGHQLWMYDLNGGDVTSDAFGNFLGALTIPAEITGIQGVAWKSPYFYFSCADSPLGNRIERVKYLGSEYGLADMAEIILHGYGTEQGLAFDGETALQVFQKDGEHVYSLINLHSLEYQIAEVPEPSTCGLMASGAIAVLVTRAYRRTERSNTAA